MSGLEFQRISVEGRAGPLVSCIMPTRGREHRAAAALRMLRRQRYSNVEAVVVEVADSGLRQRCPADLPATFVRAPEDASLGTLRNFACRAARGEIIVLWDDDDWHGPDRISAQLQPIVDGRADLTGLRDVPIFDETTGQAWRCSRALFARMFRRGIASGTTMFRRVLWGRGNRFRPYRVGEDAAFVEGALAGGARLAPVDGYGLFVYVRHGRNTWSFECGTHCDPQHWTRESLDAVGWANAPIGVPPLVTCIMPTRHREQWARRAVEAFLRQDYARCELVVVPEPDDIVPQTGRVRRVEVPRPGLSVGAKRNVACQEARGEIIVHWDDDDWHAPGRVRLQVERLLRSDADLCGSSRVLFLDCRAEQAWEYVYPRGHRPWVAGATFCYHRGAWERGPFEDCSRGEDTRFLWRMRPPRLVEMPRSDFHVAMLHGSNTASKPARSNRWKRRPYSEVRDLLGADSARYAPTRSRS